MAGATDIGESAFLNAVLRGSSAGILANSTCFISLYTGAEPGDDGTGGTECLGQDYDPTLVTWGPTSSTAEDTTGATLTNVGVITFTSSAQTSPAWGEIVGYAIHIAANLAGVADSNRVISGVWDTAAVVTTGDTVQIAAGDLVITCG